MEDDDFFEDPVVRGVLLHEKNFPDFKMCKFFTIDIYEFKLVRLILFFLKIGFTVVCLVQSYLFLTEFKLSYLAQYGPFYFMALYALVCVICQPFMTKIITENIIHMQVISTKNAPPEIKEEIKKTEFYNRLYVAFAVVSTIFVSISFAIPTENDKEIIFVLKFIETYFPSWYTFLSLIFKLCLPPVMFITATSPAFNVVYYQSVTSTQFLLFKYCLEKIDANYENLDYIDRNNLEYHNQVTRRLHFCVKHYIEFQKHGREAVQRTEKFVFPYKILALLGTISIVGFYFSFEGSLSDQYARSFGLFLIVAVALSGSAIGGQKIEDIVDDVSDAFENLHWYHWNESNKKTYLICLLTVVRKYSIKFGENLSLNYKLSLEFIKALYSFASVMYQLQEMREQ